MEKYSLLKLTGFTNGQLRHILANELGFKGTAPDPKAADYRMRMIDIICDVQDGKKPTTLSFVVADHFTLDNTAIKFSYIGRNFKSYFSDKIEEEIVCPQNSIDLSRTARDSEIIAYIGDEAQAEVTLSGIYELLKLQPKGEAGNLLSDGEINIFYVHNTSLNQLRPIGAAWSIGRRGWAIDVFPLDNPGGWKTGSRIFYR